MILVCPACPDAIYWELVDLKNYFLVNRNVMYAAILGASARFLKVKVYQFTGAFVGLNKRLQTFAHTCRAQRIYAVVGTLRTNLYGSE